MVYNLIILIFLFHFFVAVVIISDWFFLPFFTILSFVTFVGSFFDVWKQQQPIDWSIVQWFDSFNHWFVQFNDLTWNEMKWPFAFASHGPQSIQWSIVKFVEIVQWLNKSNKQTFSFLLDFQLHSLVGLCLNIVDI